ncbi:pentapeptide repeat-containing protein [Prauserella muralis]|uniref:Pentapeptide repeat protein n=1 Tax=Prauserella muralis TaxID=588067 RepID=A0A2V4ADF3_9PSEU|nr:pentapeptide repeat-containing protein [Prauserella muralis]PXY16614.1 hypothetical protein BAY60_36095 [Prauserella muralis]
MSYTVLSPRAIWSAAAVILLLGIGVAVWLLLAYGRGDAQARNQLEAIKTAGTIVVGTGGAAALLLAARRQRTAEIALRQKEQDQADVARAYELQKQTAETSEADAVARRITEEYTKAVDQLGSNKAAVRLGGLYALERLAQNNVAQRQTIVNVLCAYLRMPYTPPRAVAQPRRLGVRRPLLHTSRRAAAARSVNPASPADRDATAAQEREVRLAAQRILTTRLRIPPSTAPDTAAAVPAAPLPVDHWADIDIDLTGATLINLVFDDCRLRNANFQRATFIGTAIFNGVQFTGNAVFNEVQFTSDAFFFETRFAGNAWFEEARFTREAVFLDPWFGRDPEFQGARFDRSVPMDVARFVRPDPPSGQT